MSCHTSLASAGLAINFVLIESNPIALTHTLGLAGMSRGSELTSVQSENVIVPFPSRPPIYKLSSDDQQATMKLRNTYIWLIERIAIGQIFDAVSIDKTCCSDLLELIRRGIFRFLSRRFRDDTGTINILLVIRLPFWHDNQQ